MRVSEYKRVESVINGLRNVVTNPKQCEISGSMYEMYAAIAEQQTRISLDNIKGIYSVGKINDIYHIVVVYNSHHTRDILTRPMATIISTSENTYYDVVISFTGYDIFDSLPVLYTEVYNMILPSPLDDIYLVYCFFNAFRGVYTTDDITEIVNKLTMVDSTARVIQYMIDNYSRPGFIPDALSITRACKVIELEIGKEKSKNTSTETK